MAKPAKESDPTDAVVEEQEVPPSSHEGGVQVVLKETPTKDAPSKEKASPAPEPDEAAERRWKALESQVAATRRVNETLQRTVQELTSKLQAPPAASESGAQVLPTGTSQETIDKYDKLVADGKWQEAVRVLSREEYRTARQVEVAEEQVRSIQSRRLSALERSKLMVESTYPALHRDTGNPEAPETQFFNQALTELSAEYDQFLSDPYAPQLAMHRMEQLAASHGIKLTKAITQPLSSARPSAGRAGQTSMPASRGAGGASTYTLSPDQKEWCDANLSHLPEGERYKHYAQFAKMAESGGVET